MAINLLPEVEKRELKQEEIWQKLLLLLILLAIFFLILIFILFSLKIYISSKTNQLKFSLQEKENEFKSSQFQNFKETINQANQELSRIEQFHQEQILISSFLEKLSQLVPKTIYFKTFFFKKIVSPKTESGPEEEKEIGAEVHILGWAQTREDLFFFKKELEKIEEFKEVYFLPSSWTKPQDLEFSLSFKLVKIKK
ncbi:MAG: hypothetical protein QMC93_02425 [Patescibacteria group bacterium]|nr:hypothetical protein [Patescibacteria group bacterium]